jgi:hypothetical protein
MESEEGAGEQREGISLSQALKRSKEDEISGTRGSSFGESGGQGRGAGEG